MSQQYPGGFITKSPPATVGPVDGEGGSAPGVWTLDQAMALNKQGLWPKPIIQGELWSWGYNLQGQLGLGDTVSRSSPTQVGALASWTKIAQGATHTIAIKTDGTLWAWGNNTAVGALGINNTISRSSPVQVGALTNWSKASAANRFSLAVKTDGTLWAWGENSRGALGDGTKTNRSSPVQVGALTNWSQAAAAGNTGFSLAIKSDSTLWAWGYNKFGQLGVGLAYNPSDPYAQYDFSSPVQVGSGWAKVSAGNYHTLALKTNGTLWSWGRNTDGQLGQNNTTNLSNPVQIGSLNTWSQISAGFAFSFAIKTDGTLWAWGRNGSGYLGLGNILSRSSPVQVGALTNWSKIAGGSWASLAIKTDGTLWAWGFGGYGSIGNQSTASQSSPTQVGALTTWVGLPTRSVSAHSMAIKS